MKPSKPSFTRTINSLKCLFFIVAVTLPIRLSAQSDPPEGLAALSDSVEFYFSSRNFDRGIALADSLFAQKAFEKHPTLHINTRYSLAKIYILKGEEAKAREILDVAYDMALSNDTARLAIRVNDLRANSYFETSNYDSARTYFHLSMVLADSLVPRDYPRTLANMGFINGLVGDEEQEMGYYIKMLEELEINPEYDGRGSLRAMAYGGLGDYYSRTGEYEKAKQQYEAKLKLGRDTDRPAMIYEASYGLGNLYAKSDYYDFEKSEANYLRVTQDTTERYKYYKGRTLIVLGKLYEQADKDAQALKALDEALTFFNGSSSVDYVARIQIETAKIHFKNKRYAVAENLVRPALAEALENRLAYRERDALGVLYKLDSTKGDYRASLRHYQRYRNIEDSLQSKDAKERLQELQVKYETEQTEKQNLLLKGDLNLKEAELKQKTILQIVFIVVSGLMLIIVLLVYRSYRRKQQLNHELASKNEIISEQKDELQFKTDKLQIINSQLKSLFDFRKDLTRMIAHDMKNPLNSIIGISSSMGQDERVSNISKSGHQLLNLITNMLEVEKMEEVKIDPKKELLFVDELMKEAREQVELLVAAKSILLQNFLPKELAIEADRQLMVRVLVNLLTNAIKYSGNGGAIKIYHGHEENKVVITIEDEGVGISKERVPFIFDKFWQANQRQSGLATSNGLGLTYCKLAVEAHGGTIEAQSVLGEGTKMVFALPYEGQKINSKQRPEEHQELGFILNEDFEILQNYWEVLSTLKVYEVSAVKRILKQLDAEGIKSTWKDELLKAVYQADEAMFDELLNLIKPIAEE
ncbi:tetratricopeptide repeat-containing sensor histidine kinase [Roseivirga pacifica]